MASASGSRLSRDAYKKAKELEEARKAGTAPAALDDEGKEINPHIPQYIADAPWYLSKDTPSLKHQKSALGKKEGDKDWYERGKKAGPAATKFRKGACTNCGAMTHQAKDCCEKPRKIGAKFNPKDIAPDEIVKELHLDFDGTRDRWNGYDPEEYAKVVEQYERVEQERRRKKKEEEMEKLLKGEVKVEERKQDSDSESDTEETDEKNEYYDAGNIAVGQKKDSKTRTTVRNLRIREDIAKYLRNLDPNSAYYDPKSRSMRENPTPEAKKEDQLLYQGDNFIRSQGDIKNFAATENFAWDAQRKGEDIHLQAAPSQAELVFRDFKQKKEVMNKSQREAILAKYGGSEHLVDVNNPADPLLKTQILAQTEDYVEYGRDGGMVKGKGKNTVRSKYPEDVFPHNHTSVWGSFWQDGQWGFACCHQFAKNSYCTGDTGKRLNREMLETRSSLAGSEESQPVSSSNTQQPGTFKQPLDTPDMKKKKLEDALKKEEEKRKEEKDERKRGYNSSSQDNYQVSEEDMEAYNLKKLRWEDPMYSSKFKQV